MFNGLKMLENVIINIVQTSIAFIIGSEVASWLLERKIKKTIHKFSIKYGLTEQRVSAIAQKLAEFFEVEL